MKKILLVVTIVLLTSAMFSVEMGWGYGRVVDDFGDDTGVRFLRNVGVGKFSNRVTANSKVLFRVGIDSDFDAVTIILFEYIRYPVFFSNSMYVNIKVKIDNEEPYNLKAFVFNKYLSISSPQSDLLIKDFKRASYAKILITYEDSRYSLSFDCNEFTSKYNKLYKQNKKGE